MGRAVPAAPDIPGRSAASRSARPRRLSLAGQELLNGGQIPGARRLQQFLLLPHLTARRSGAETITRAHESNARLSNAVTSIHAFNGALSDRSGPLGTPAAAVFVLFPLQAQPLRGNFLFQRPRTNFLWHGSTRHFRDW